MRSRPLGNKRARNATGTIALAAVLGAAGGGCGFVFSQGPPDDHGSRLYFDCGESYAPPVLDSIALGASGFAALGAADSETMTASEQRTGVAIAAGYAVLSAASAIYGFQAVADCRRARRRRLDDWTRAQITLWPGAGADPWADPAPALTAPSR